MRMSRFTPVRPEPIGPGEESVWRYPRPPALEPVEKRIRIVFHGEVVADTRKAWRVLETSHPPVYYLPPDDIRMDLLERAGGGSWCEWKGQARYWTLRVGDQTAERVAWSYPDPSPRFEALRDHLAFYAGPLDSATVAGVEVEPQPGGFYGGWVTPEIKGPFKGGPGTMGW
ncbi:MAG: DUF427 domain-containing protein [Gemmatimonadota bacterium]|jgi:uncharacterized protein (DUF427 family)